MPAQHAKRVKLTADLSSYNSKLTGGQMGWTCPDSHAQWGVIVSYDCGARLDTLWKSLEIDKEATKAHEHQHDIEQLKFFATRLIEDAGYGKRALQKLMGEAVDAAKPKRKGKKHD